MQYEYEVALSFAGENRKFAENIAAGLRDAGINVFYDDYYAEELWGEDLAVKLRDVYHSSSQFCIMIISEHYINKMWPSHERRQAIERMIQEQGKTYVLPVRLDGYGGEVPGMSGSIGYLWAKSTEPQIVVDAFLRKIGRNKGAEKPRQPTQTKAPPNFPKLKKSYTDKEKNEFLKASFTEIVDFIDGYAETTKQENPQFDYETERITTRKALITIYVAEQQKTQLKIWIGGILGSNSIAVSHGNNVDVNADGSMNESFTLEEHDGQLMLTPLFSMSKKKPLTPKEVADYLWKNACRAL